MSSSQGNTAEAGMASKLRELAGTDQELAQTLARLMILDPKKINMSLETFLSEAQDFETHGNMMRAEVAYRVAGALSLFQGDVDGVRRYFTKAMVVSGKSGGEYKTLVDHVEDAVAVAKKYYASI